MRGEEREGGNEGGETRGNEGGSGQARITWEDSHGLSTAGPVSRGKFPTDRTPLSRYRVGSFPRSKRRRTTLTALLATGRGKGAREGKSEGGSPRKRGGVRLGQDHVGGFPRIKQSREGFPTDSTPLNRYRAGDFQRI